MESSFTTMFWVFSIPSLIFSAAVLFSNPLKLLFMVFYVLGTAGCVMFSSILCHACWKVSFFIFVPVFLLNLLIYVGNLLYLSDNAILKVIAFWTLLVFLIWCF